MRLTDLIVDQLPARAVYTLSKVKARVRRLIADRRFRPFINEQFPKVVDSELLVATDDAAVYRLSFEDQASLILKIAVSDVASEQLRSEADALGELAELPELADWQIQTARVQEVGEIDGGHWFTQSLVPGDPMSSIDAASPEMTAAAARAIHGVHDATSHVVPVASDVLERLIEQPLKRLGTWRPHAAPGLAVIQSLLTEKLTGTNLALSRLHGDFAPSNVLWDGSTDDVSSIVDWKFDHELLPPEVDTVHFAISLIALRDRQEYGSVVVDALSAEPGAQLTTAVQIAVEEGPNHLDTQTAVTLAWLQHISFGLHKAHDLRENPIWLGKNIDQVVTSFEGLSHEAG